MQTLRTAAALFAAADSLAALGPIAAVAGCGGVASPLDKHTRIALGIDGTIVEASIAPGPGTLRALLVTVDANANLRDTLPRLAGRLAARAPHLLWLIVAAHPTTREVALAAWSDDRRPPRVSVLLTHRESIADSDAETLRSLSATAQVGGRDVLIHARWVEILSRESLSIRFYRALEQAVHRLAASSPVGAGPDRHQIALLNTSRLLFLSFLEAKGWMNRDAAFLIHQFDDCMMHGGRFHDRVLRPLFFGTLNTPCRRRARTASRFGDIPFLNGGLFARTPIERACRGLAFSDEAYGALISGVFGQFRFTAREETATWTEAAIDPEMLGRAFESLMAAPERQRTGAFYTPFPLVERLANAGLDAAIANDPSNPIDALRTITVLDPACGSGAFLVYLLERIANQLRLLGDPRDVSAIRREVLTRSIFGVDMNPTAVWLCELRLWLSVVIESNETNPRAIVPLPNLDRNIRTGDALAAQPFGDHDDRVAGGTALGRLRQRYARASGARKRSLSREFDRAERKRATETIDLELSVVAEQRRDLVALRRGRDLFGGRYEPSRDEHLAAERFRLRAAALRAARHRIVTGGALPFSFPVHFGDVAARGGFGLVIGNPPWVRMHHVTPRRRSEFRRNYVVARSAAWESGATPSGAGRGFAGQVDVAALFVERSLQLLAPRAMLALLVPIKLWQSLAGGGVRRLIADSADIDRLEDLSEAATSFDAAVYPSLIVARRRGAIKAPPGAALDDRRGQGRHRDSPPPRPCLNGVDRRNASFAVHRRGAGAFMWKATPQSLPYDASPGAPWLLLPPEARRAFDQLRIRGVPLANSPLGRPLLGLKCGCNDAFIVSMRHADACTAHVTASNGKHIEIERDMLRPLLRGEQLNPWMASPSTQHIIWTHVTDSRGADGGPLESLPTHTAHWLRRWKRRLDARSDARHRCRWWALFRTDGAAFDRPRVVWGDLGRQPRAIVLDAGDPTVPLNSCYVIRCATPADAHALATLLNGPLIRAWVAAVTEPARGGYRRYLGWSMSLLPIPHDWPRARDILAPVGKAARQRSQTSAGDSILSSRASDDYELLLASLRAYDMDHETAAPLVAWMSC